MDELELACESNLKCKKTKEEEEEEEKGTSKKQSKVESVPFFGLFGAADRTDYVLMFLGSVGSFVHGAALPVSFVLFGCIIDSLGHLSSNPHKFSSQISQVKKTALNILISLVIKSLVAKVTHTKVVK